MSDIFYGYQADEFIDMNEAGGENFFCANCGHVELVGNSKSPDSSLCCDCYKYNNDDSYVGEDDDCFDDAELEAYHNGLDAHLDGYGENDE